TDSTFVIGPAIFPRVTARRVCREAKSRSQFSHVSKRRPIWRESLARLLLTRIWPLFSEVAPAFQRLARSADSRRRQNLFRRECRRFPKRRSSANMYNSEIGLAFAIGDR